MLFSLVVSAIVGASCVELVLHECGAGRWVVLHWRCCATGTIGWWGVGALAGEAVMCWGWGGVDGGECDGMGDGVQAGVGYRAGGGAGMLLRRRKRESRAARGREGVTEVGREGVSGLGFGESRGRGGDWDYDAGRRGM